MHATFRQFKKCKTFAGVDPLNKIAADNKIFPAGLFLMNGWLFHNHSWSQWLQDCLILMKVHKYLGLPGTILLSCNSIYTVIQIIMN